MFIKLEQMVILKRYYFFYIMRIEVVNELINSFLVKKAKLQMLWV
ncbi:hypothetical protein CHCC20375_0792 [Bacillus licheniformis]|nr:hypothetical protein CHCC20375_0792 [Bacillus licheniformis]